MQCCEERIQHHNFDSLVHLDAGGIGQKIDRPGKEDRGKKEKLRHVVSDHCDCCFEYNCVIVAVRVAFAFESKKIL